MHLRLAAAACYLLAIVGFACGGGDDPSASGAPDSADIATATLPAELPEPLIVGGGVVQPGGTAGYTIRDGDTLAGVASDLGISLEDLLAANPGINPSTLRVGDAIRLPEDIDPSAIATAADPEAEPTEAPEAQDTPEPEPTDVPEPVATNTPSSLGQSYIVQSGDIPETIAAQFGITTDALLAANPGINVNNLQVGQALIIPAAAARPPEEAPPEGG